MSEGYRREFMVFRSWMKKLTDPAGLAPARTQGRPPSGNGASSFHLTWEVPPTEFAEVSVTFELLEPPSVEMLYFWAVQVNFVDGQTRRGGAHFGLQYNPLFPNSHAVNWGGYHDGGGELEGSVSDLPSTPDHINTRDYPWQANRQYRHRIYKSDQGWRGSITDLVSGTTTVVRDLWIEADRLVGPMVWSEVFAHCDHPSLAVRWSDLQAITLAGDPVTIDAVRLNYQTYANGGCANTNTSVDGSGFVQRTNTERINRTGDRLSLGRPDASPA
jgi:hypothetical protein